MSEPHARRGFLRGLASLPLIGGGVTLIGQPTAAAIPVTPRLLDSYDAWLKYERRMLIAERYGNKPPTGDMRPLGPDVVLLDRRTGLEFIWTCEDNAGARFHGYGPSDPMPSTRAAVVLSAIGCDWTAS